jgi:hypothetical protein
MFGFKKKVVPSSKYSTARLRSLSDEDFYNEREIVRSAFEAGNLQAEKYLHFFDKVEPDRLNAQYERNNAGKKSASRAKREHGYHLYKDDD